MNEQDLKDLEDGDTIFPISQAYAKAPQYREFFKSETAISRAILKQAAIPRFAMGSVETKENTLLYIPLGSNHGVIARGNQRIHYLWIDCTPQEQKDAAAYLDEVHKPTGEIETL